MNKLKKQIPFFILLILIASSTTVWFANELKKTRSNLENKQDTRFKSMILADELRQSSDDLTKMARLYVETRNLKYLNYYNKILDIRNGEKERPKGYESIYWDYVLAGEDSLLDKGKGVFISMESQMHDLQFSDEEFKLLMSAQGRSNKLAKVELSAFKDIQEYKKKKSSKLLAQAKDKLYNLEYFKQKAYIMEPISQFLHQVKDRTFKDVQNVRKKKGKLISRIFLSSILLLVLLFIFFALISKNIYSNKDQSS